MKTDLKEIINIVDNIDISNYHKDRNFIDGSITKLSPYISRGLISTKFIYKSLKKRNLKVSEKFIQELAWREYWQIIWKNKNINEDLKQKQKDVENHGIPTNIVNHSTGINVIDQAIKELYSHGYIHNHLRMYIASIVCNIAKCHWKIPAKWFYYNLIDGDWGSNALSWQWVCGSNSSKKYIANQDNINKYCYDKQKNTFLDRNYSDLYNYKIPNKLRDIQSLDLKTKIPINNRGFIDINKPILLYNYYNIDPKWRKDINANRVLLIEPSFFEKNPISEYVFDFFLKLAENITDLIVVKSEFKDFAQKNKNSKIYFKEHPLNNHYKGNCDEREWMFKNQNYYPSFFKFWNASKNELEI